MKKFKVKIVNWHNGLMYTCHADIRTGSLESGNHSSQKAAKCAFVSICNRLGIPRENYDFEEVKK